MTLELPSPALLEQHTSIDDLPEQFHESTKYWRADMMNKAASIASFLFDPLYIERSLRVGARNPLNPVRPLPDGPSPDMPLAAALQARASIRTFTPQAVTEDKVGGLLRSALAASRSSQVGEDMMLRFRPYPSGGGLYPIEFYLIAMNVEGLEAGIARYDPVQHGLQRLRTGTPADFLRTQINPPKDATPAFAVVLTSVTQRTTAKYGARGYRFAMREAGHASQNLMLAAAGLGLGCTAWGGYFDDELSRLCGADGVLETAAGVLFFGWPA